MTVYLITRHAGAIDWIKANKVQFDVHLEHLASIDGLMSGDVVIGNLPVNIIANINALGVRYVHLSLDVPARLRGAELTVDQLNDCHVTLQTYHVQKSS